MLSQFESSINVPTRIAGEDYDEIRAALEILCTHGGLHEIRVPKAGRYKTISGNYDDLDKMAEDALYLTRQGHPGVYFTINSVVPELKARTHNNFQKYAESTGGDVDIVRRTRFFADADVKRPAGISSTDEEHALAIATAFAIRDYLTGQGWPEPVVADSGNGAHDTWAIDLPNDPESKALVEGCLQALDARFGTGRIGIDKSVGNAARICKIPGTWARKGADWLGDATTPARPHRVSQILDRPDRLETVPRALLERLAAEAPAKASSKTSTRTTFRATGSAVSTGRKVGEAGWDRDRLESWLDDHGIGRQTPVVDRSNPDRLKYVLDACPFDETHVGKDAAIFLTIDGPDEGMLGFHCFHDSCHHQGWVNVREHFGPDALEEVGDDTDERVHRVVGAAESLLDAFQDSHAREEAYAPKEGGESTGRPLQVEKYAGDLRQRDIPHDEAEHKGKYTWVVDCPCCRVSGQFFWENGVSGYVCAKGRRSWLEARSLWARRERPRRKAISIEEVFLLPDPEWLVEDHFHHGRFVLVYGPSGVAKSFFMLDAALCIALGRPFLGKHEVRKGTVVYIYSEGDTGLKYRLRAWLTHHEIESTPQEIRFIASSFDLLQEGEVEDLMAIIDRDMGGVDPDLIIVDTLARNNGGDENDSKDMNLYVSNLDRLKETFSSTVCSVHHTGKDATRKGRGHSSLPAACDTILELMPENPNESGDPQSLVVRCEKLKDGQPFTTYRLDKEKVVFGPGKYDDSIVLLPSDHVPRAKVTASDKKKTAKLFDLDAIHNECCPEPDEPPLLKKEVFERAEKRAARLEGLDNTRDHGIPDKRCRALIDWLVSRELLEAIEAPSKMPNHRRYRKLNPGRVDFFSLYGSPGDAV